MRKGQGKQRTVMMLEISEPEPAHNPVSSYFVHHICDPLHKNIPKPGGNTRKKVAGV
jgi:hypothetical protein